MNYRKITHARDSIFYKLCLWVEFCGRRKYILRKENKTAYNIFKNKQSTIEILYDQFLYCRFFHLPNANYISNYTLTPPKLSLPKFNSQTKPYWITIGFSKILAMEKINNVKENLNAKIWEIRYYLFSYNPHPTHIYLCHLECSV